MKKWIPRNNIRILVAAGAFVAAVAGGTLAAGSAQASYVICRTDPTVTLNNGVTVTMWAEVAADPSQIQNVHYVLHVPRGVAASGVSYDAYRSIESLTIIPDQPGHHYQIDTMVTTSATAAVTAYATIDRGKTKTGNAKGNAGQNLTIKFRS